MQVVANIYNHPKKLQVCTELLNQFLVFKCACAHFGGRKYSVDYSKRCKLFSKNCLPANFWNVANTRKNMLNSLQWPPVLFVSTHKLFQEYGSQL